MSQHRPARGLSWREGAAAIAVLCACSATPVVPAPRTKATRSQPDHGGAFTARYQDSPASARLDDPSHGRSASAGLPPALPATATDDGAGALELTWTQTLYAAPLIAGMCLATVRDPVAGLLCTGVATAGTAVLSSHLSEGVAAGQAQVIESVGPWLVGAGLRMAVTFDASVSQLGAVIAGLGYLSGPFIGMATASRTADPGTVALANSLGIWSAFGIELVRIGWSDRPTASFRTRSHFTPASALGTLAGAGLGIVAGAALGRELRPTRLQVWALDGLALAGTALFAAMGQVVGPSLCASCNREQGAARGATIGLAVGAALGLWRLPNWTGPDALALHPRLGVSLDGTTVVGVGAEW